ncbi:MAG: VWA domain-containing protein [Ruminococcus sp.]|nr:VWA domain-containing protein [Ruminococcus sp.]
MKKNNNITELVFILDRSGSMGGLEADTIGGFNGMIEKQKKEEGTAYVSTILFDNESEVIHDRVKLSEIRPMTDKDYYVRGCTALLDAIGSAVKHISNIHKYARPEDVPEHTMFVITTDGMENASSKFTYKEIKDLIGKQKELGWEFLFIGANIDAVEVAEKVGISKERTANYVSDAVGTSKVFQALSAPISAMRRNMKIDREWAETLEEDKASRG